MFLLCLLLSWTPVFECKLPKDAPRKGGDNLFLDNILGSDSVDVGVIFFKEVDLPLHLDSDSKI